MSATRSVVSCDRSGLKCWSLTLRGGRSHSELYTLPCEAGQVTNHSVSITHDNLNQSSLRRVLLVYTIPSLFRSSLLPLVLHLTHPSSSSQSVALRPLAHRTRPNPTSNVCHHRSPPGCQRSGRSWHGCSSQESGSRRASECVLTLRDHQPRTGTRQRPALMK